MLLPHCKSEESETKKIYEKILWLITNLQPSSHVVYISGIDSVDNVFDMIYPPHNSDPLNTDMTEIRFLLSQMKHLQISKEVMKCSFT